ncbi:MAG: hypothetical protein ABIS07_18035 [Dokdonella sp.]
MNVRRNDFFPLRMGMLLTASLMALGSTCARAMLPGRSSAIHAPHAPLGLLPISDLLPDPAFMGSGYTTVDFNDAFGKKDVALRVFPSLDGGYWLAGYNAELNIDIAGDMAIAKLNADGSLNNTYFGTGKLRIPSSFFELMDVAMGANQRLYFAGSTILPTASDEDVLINCIDSAGNPCSDFTSGTAPGRVLAAFDLGDAGHRDDVATRIIYHDGQLYVIGRTDTGIGASNFAMFVLKLDATTGQRDAAFGNVAGAPGLAIRNFDFATNGFDVANDLVYARGAPDDHLVIVGQIARAAAPDKDGIVYSIDADTGLEDGLILDSVYYDLGTTKEDALTRIIQRHDGGFVVAGYSLDVESTYAGAGVMMAAYRPDGSRDLRFGLPGDNGSDLILFSAFTSQLPFGLAERAGTRDLILGSNAFNMVTDSIHVQNVAQLGASGIPLHAYSTLDLAGAGSTPHDTSGSDLILLGDQVLTAGDRRWTILPADRDMTVARYIANDSIFADQFGGPQSD